MSNTFEFAERFGFSSLFEQDDGDNHGLKGFDYNNTISFNRFIKAIKKQKLKGKRTYAFDYRHFIEILSENVFKTEEGEDIIASKVYGNKRIADLNLNNWKIKMRLDLKNKQVLYQVLGQYNTFDTSLEEDRLAVKIHFKDYTHFRSTIDLLFGDEQTRIENYIFKKFIKAFESAKDNYSVLSWLYEIAPDFIINKRDPDDTYRDFVYILERMSSTFYNSVGVDQNMSILNILSNLDKAFVFNKFKEDEGILFTILDKLDSDYDLPFVSVVTNICYDQWKNDDFKNKNTIKVGESEEVNYYIYKIEPTIDFTGEISPEGKVNFLNVKKRGSSDDFIGIINAKSFRLMPLEALYVSTVNDETLWIPAIALEPFIQAAETREKITFYTDILFVLATAGSLKILQSASAPVFLKVIAAIELAKAPIDVAMRTYSFRKALAKTEEGKWFVENWKIISTTVDITTLSSGFLYTLSKNGSKIAAFFRKKKKDDAADGLDQLVKEVEKHLDEVTELDLKVLSKNASYKKYLDELKRIGKKRIFKDLLSVEEEAILKFYTTNKGYKNFNKALRGEIKMNDFYKSQERLMNQALDKLPNYKTEDVLYRIENLSKTQISNYYKVGKEVTNKHFTSTTYDIDAIAEAMRNRQYTIMIIIKNSKSGKKIEALSTLKKEKEIIFKSDTTFLVEKVSIGTNPDTLGPIKTIILKEK